MRTRGPRLLTVAVAVLTVGAGGLLLTLPPKSRVVDLAGWTRPSPPTVAGAFHVHTTRSDGDGSPDEVAQAALRAGLQFVIFTDHGDGTRPPDPPQYRFGVLSLDGVEISTTGGHYIALGLPRTPYPLGGEADGVVEDVRRLGGFGVVAHPASVKPELRWQDADLAVDAIEWINGDSQWRDESGVNLLLAALQYTLRPTEVLGALLDRPEESLELWDRMSRRSRVVGLAGNDAHGRVEATTDAEEGKSVWAFPFPDYEHMFRTLSLRVELERSWSGDSRRDGQALLDAMRAGRVYTVVDALATPSAFRFEAVATNGIYAMGERVPSGVPVELHVQAAAPARSNIVLIGDGQAVATVTDSELRYTVSHPGVYRAEVHVSGAPGSPPVPWIVSNPIHVGDAPAPNVRQSRPAPRATETLAGGADGTPAPVWTVEHDGRSTATITSEADRLLFKFRLSDSGSGNPYAAAVRTLRLGALETFDRVGFEVVSDRPVRLFVQVRAGANPEQPRWRKSFYADTIPRRVTIAFGDLEPVSLGTPTESDRADADALLVVVESVNALPGSAATIVLSDLRLERE